MTEAPVPANTLVQAEGGKFLVVDGVPVDSASGVITMDGQVFYFYAYGMVQNVSQLALYDNEWFVVREGMVDIGYTGLYDYDNATFVITDGQVRYDYTGPWIDPERGEVWVIEGMVP